MNVVVLLVSCCWLRDGCAVCACAMSVQRELAVRCSVLTAGIGRPEPRVSGQKREPRGDCCAQRQGLAGLSLLSSFSRSTPSSSSPLCSLCDALLCGSVWLQVDLVLNEMCQVREPNKRLPTTMCAAFTR
eukprot:1198820-Rhodomonas_salina.1